MTTDIDWEARAEAAERSVVVQHDVIRDRDARIAELEARLAQSPEVTAEEYIQGMIDKAPEPLRRLGEWLTKMLDDDQWKTAERMLNGAVVSGMASDVQARLRQSRDQVGRLQSQVDRHKHEREEAEARLVKEIDRHMETARKLDRMLDRETLARRLRAQYMGDPSDTWEDAGDEDRSIYLEMAGFCLAAIAAMQGAAQPARAPDREAVARALAKALNDGVLYGTVTMNEYIEPIEKFDLPDWGIPWPEHPYDRAAFIREAQYEIMAGVLADAAIAAMQGEPK